MLQIYMVTSAFVSVQSLQSGVMSHEPSVMSLHEAGGKLIASSSADNTADIQQDLQELSNK